MLRNPVVQHILGDYSDEVLNSLDLRESREK